MIWFAYREVTNAANVIARERLVSLTQQFAGLSQQSTSTGLTRTFSIANGPAIRSFLVSPSATTKSTALQELQQLDPAQDPANLQIELWKADRTLALTIPENSPPITTDLSVEFEQCAREPFKTPGLLRALRGDVAGNLSAAVRDEHGTPIGFLVRWRKTTTNPKPEQLRQLLGNDATLYFGNANNDVWTDLTKIVPNPLPSLNGEMAEYKRDGRPVIALERSIPGTPWAVAIEISNQAFANQSRVFLRRTMLIGLGILLTGLAAAFIISRSITRPLDVLTEVAAAVTNGDYSRQVAVAGNNELGKLAQAFNTMVAKLRNSQRELEQKVHERTAQLEAAAGALLMVDKNGLIRTANQKAEALFGYGNGELTGQSVDQLVPERYRAGHEGLRKGFFAHAETRPMGAGRELFGKRRDGGEVPIEIGLNPIHTDEGAFVLANIIDISERKRAEERFRLVVEAAPNAMIMVDSKGLMTLVNQQAEHLFGYSREELLGQPVDMLVPARYRSHHPGHRSTFAERPSARAMGAGRDLFGLRKDGSEMPIEIGLNPIQTGEGRFVLASIIDITERKRAESQFRQVIEHAPNGMVMVNREGKIAMVNAQIEKWFGYERDELLGRSIEMLVPQRFHANHASYRDGFIAQPSTRSMGAGRDLYGLRKDGTEFPVEIGLNPMETEQGMMVLGTIVDITERKQAEEKLRKSQEQLAGVIGSAMDAIISINDKQRIVLFNAAAERMFLYPTEDAIGKPLDQFIPERFRAGHKGHIQNFDKTNVTKRGMGAMGALYGLRADGEEFPIEASISQIESDGQKLFTVILRDVSERKRSEEALKEQARILDLAPVLIRDLNGRILFWNTGSEQMYGWKAGEALEKTTDSLLKTEYPRAVEEIKARVLAHGHWEGELIHTTKDGRRIVVASHWVLHREEQGKPKAILEVNNDVTERKQAEREVRRLNEELEQRVADRTAQLQTVNKELEAFSYSVSHDLRAPLRHINGFSQALLEDYSDKLDEGGRTHLREVRNASQEMAQLIDDVLQLARVTRSEMRREEVNLSELARSVVADLKKRNGRPDVTVNIQDGLTTRGDKRLLRIALTNLLGNAWKFTSKQEKAEITFGSEQKNGEVFYFVRDNGAGFEMAYANKLFGAFQRLHTAGEFEGTGIGLATVQRIVHRHGGRVQAEGKLNEGATFFFTLTNSKETGDGQQSDLTG